MKIMRLLSIPVLIVCVLVGTSISCSAEVIKWTKQYGTKKYDEALSIATDMQGNIYTTGHTWGNLKGNHNMGDYDVFVTKFNKDGKHLWTKQFGTSSGDSANAIICDLEGNIYVTGETSGKLGTDAHSGGEDVFIIKLDNKGKQLWIKQFGTNENERANAITIDDTGNIYVTGYIEIPDEKNAQIKTCDILVTKLNSNGHQEWSKQFGSSFTDVAHSINHDHNNNIYIAGRSNGAFDKNTHKGDYDIILIKLNQDGKQVWTKQLGTTGMDVANAIAIDKDIYVTGYTTGSMKNKNAGLNDIFISKLNYDGQIIWSKQYGSDGQDEANSISEINDGTFFVAGKTSGNLDGNQKLGITDIFISKFDTDGKKLWTMQNGTATIDKANGISRNNNGVYIAGRTFGDLNGYKNTGRSDVVIQKIK